VGDQNVQKVTADVSDNDASSSEELVVKINRATSEVEFTNPATGKTTRLKAKIVEEDDVEGSELERVMKPLSVEEFRDAWEKLEALGIGWSTDIPPNPIFRKGVEGKTDFWKTYLEIQHNFPAFPRELSNVVIQTLMRQQAPEGETAEKAKIISGLLTQEYRSEFFFKYAIKVPYFEDIDWEVVVKAYERGVHAMPKIAYALLALTLRNPVDTSLSVQEGANQPREPQFITVAANEQLLRKLMVRLSQIRTALEKAQKAADTLTEQQEPEEVQTNGTTVIS
jgi:hypothetical protein